MLVMYKLGTLVCSKIAPWRATFTASLITVLNKTTNFLIGQYAAVCKNPASAIFKYSSLEAFGGFSLSRSNLQKNGQFKQKTKTINYVRVSYV